MRPLGVCVLALVVGAAMAGLVGDQLDPLATPELLVRRRLDRTAPPPVIGTATFYGEDFEGQLMASGVPFDPTDVRIVAANHWPLGTRLRLQRVPGGPWDATLTAEERAQYFTRVVEVTVQDRGAFTHELDLSAGAFQLLGRPAEGRIRVAIEVLPSEGVVPVPVRHTHVAAHSPRPTGAGRRGR